MSKEEGRGTTTIWKSNVKENFAADVGEIRVPFRGEKKHP